MMSWDAYIDNLIAQSKDASGTAHCDQACIIGLDGSPWTTDNPAGALKLSPDERSTLAHGMKTADFSLFQSAGIVAGGVKYQFLRAQDKMALGKKKGHGAITVQASRTAVVIGHTKEGGQQGNTNKAVSVIADYLESLGM